MALAAVNPLPLVRVEKVTLVRTPVAVTVPVVPESPHISHLPKVPCAKVFSVNPKLSKIANITYVKLFANP